MNEIISQLWAIVWPIVQLFVATVGPVVVGWLVTRIADVLRINGDVARAEFERQLRDALHQAAENALKVVATKLLTARDTDNVDVLKSLVIDNAEALIDYVGSKNPEAVKYFNLDRSAIMDIIRSKAPAIFGRV